MDASQIQITFYDEYTGLYSTRVLSDLLGNVFDTSVVEIVNTQTNNVVFSV